VKQEKFLCFSITIFSIQNLYLVFFNTRLVRVAEKRLSCSEDSSGQTWADKQKQDIAYQRQGVVLAASRNASPDQACYQLYAVGCSEPSPDTTMLGSKCFPGGSISMATDQHPGM